MRGNVNGRRFTERSEREAVVKPQHRVVGHGGRIDVVVDAMNDGPHARVPTISCVMPPESNMRSTSRKPLDSIRRAMTSGVGR